MLILGIDTSCDDTSSSVVKDGEEILSNIVSSQETVHRKYGGIVPELASRRHIEMIWAVVDEALAEAKITLNNLSAVAVCHGPGLIGSLLVGCSFAKMVCYTTGLPLVSVNHLEGHIFSCFLTSGKDAAKESPRSRHPEFPFISLIVSGGHTSLYRVDGFGSYTELGRTRDDAAGEAYDKVSKLLGLGYPGGPAIDSSASAEESKATEFPRAYLNGSYDFSFSGLKTAVRNFMRDHASFSVNDVCAGFQRAVVDVLVKKTVLAVRREAVYRVAVAGGVAANSALRRELAQRAATEGFELFLPPERLCTDNAAMIAAAGYHHLRRGSVATLDLNPVAYLPL